MAKSTPSYLPLRLIHQLDEDAKVNRYMDWRYDALKKEYLSSLNIHLPDTKMQFIQDILKLGLSLQDEKNPEIPKYVQALTKFFLNKCTDFIPADANNLSSEIKDYLLYAPIMELWSENKQVYKPDEIFLNALMQTKNFSMGKTEIEHLPVDTFFLDLTEIVFTTPYSGAFVHISPNDTNVYIAIYLVTEDGFFSHYMRCIYDENGMLDGAIAELMDVHNNDTLGTSTDLSMMDFDITTRTFTNRTIAHAKITRLEMTRLIMQVLCYMSSKKPDIQETSVSKSLYKKPQGKPQNRYTEVQTHEIGIKYGSSIRALIKAQKTGKHKTRKHEALQFETNTDKKRKSPVPHFRCAHWQRFWTGAGRTEPVVKWIEPVFVGFSSTTENSNVIIHKIT